MLTDSTVGIVKSFESNGKISFMKFVKCAPAFKYPCASEYIDVRLVSKKIKNNVYINRRHRQKVCDLSFEKQIHSIAIIVKEISFSRE